MFTDIDEIEKERDEAFKALDKKKILAFYEKMGAPKPSSEQVLWAGVHKARLYLSCIDEDGKALSRKWLIEHGFQPGLTGFSKFN